MKTFTIFSFIILSTLISCRKQKESIASNDSIIGKWQLVQTYAGYANGGDFTWRDIPSNYSKQIEFTVNGEFSENNNLGGSPQTCTGTYTTLPDSTIEKISSCYTGIERKKISEQSSTALILSYGVIEGLIKEKYIAAK
jgi:hypothetical protein